MLPYTARWIARNICICEHEQGQNKLFILVYVCLDIVPVCLLGLSDNETIFVSELRKIVVLWKFQDCCLSVRRCCGALFSYWVNCSLKDFIMLTKVMDSVIQFLILLNKMYTYSPAHRTQCYYICDSTDFPFHKFLKNLT